MNLEWNSSLEQARTIVIAVCVLDSLVIASDFGQRQCCGQCEGALSGCQQAVAAADRVQLQGRQVS